MARSSSGKNRKPKRKIAVIDFETDPFKYGRIPRPFDAGFFDGEKHVEFWGTNCVNELLDFLRDYKEPLLIYAHNGGKFDFMYFLEHLDNPLKIINGRIAKAGFGIHEFRDSYSIIPIRLADYQKDETDYSTFEADKREQYKEKIQAYRRSDCKYLYDLVTRFNAEFGDKLTVGGTAIGELKKVHVIENTYENFDSIFRPFYYGGRVECFESGIIKGDIEVFDVNSMYPYVMSNFDHPNSSEVLQIDEPEINDEGELVGYEGQVYFARIIADNFGALPFRTNIGLDFNVPYAEFNASCHEIRVATRYGKLKIKKALQAFVFLDTEKFDTFVDKFSARKIQAKIDGDKIAELFAKFMLNSAYGKFGQNPDNFFDYRVAKEDESYIDEGYEVYEIHGDLVIWRKPVEMKLYYNVATAASITGAARAVLLEAICNTEGLIYCDTDSIITKGSIKNVRIDDKALGAWKKEASGDQIAVAGKKIYALKAKKEVVKKATKGADLSASDIFALCKGHTVTWESIAPNFKLDGNTKFVKRNIRQTK